MKQKIVILKVAGKAAEPLWKYLSDSASASGEIENPVDLSQLCERLRVSDIGPPVLFFCEYHDYWSAGDVFEVITKTRREFRSIVDGNGNVFFGYQLPDSDILLSLINDRIDGSKTDEELWFLGILKIAVTSWKNLHLPCILFIARIIKGESVTDEQILSSDKLIPNWLHHS